MGDPSSPSRTVQRPVASLASVTAPTPNRHERRRSRLDARYAQWRLSSLKRVRACGRSVVDVERGVSVLVSGSTADGTRQAGLAGVQSCGSVWACPVCSQKIQAKRQAEVATALAVARSRGWEVLFLTLTMRHNAAHSLSGLWDHLSTAWGGLTTGKGQRAWAQDKDLYGVAGYLRLVEVTHGENGWHVHVHVLLFCDPARASLLALGRNETAVRHGAGFSDAEVTALGTSMFLRWRESLNVRGIRPSLRRGVDIRRVRSDDKIADYFAKQLYHLKGEGSTAHDVSGSHGKEAKNGGRTPFGILANLVQLERTGEVDAAGSVERDLALWQTFEKASRGRRQLLWSRGFRADVLAGVEDLSDQDVVDEAPGGTEVAQVDVAVWRQIAKKRMICDLLEAAEVDDTGWMVRGWLRGDAGGRERLDWFHPDRLLT